LNSIKVPGPSTPPHPVPSPTQSFPVSHPCQPAQLPALLALCNPKANNSICPNSLHPSVCAQDHLHAWLTPYTISKCNDCAKEYPPDIIKLGKKAMITALADNTLSSYAAGVLHFNQFCDNMGISEDKCMPADDQLIIDFIGHYMGEVSGSCIKNWLSGLRAWHDYCEAPWPSDSWCIWFAQAGARIAGAHNCRPVHNPITLSHILALFFALDFSIPFHCAIWAMACTAFWGCRCLSELTVPSSQCFDPKYHATCGTCTTQSFHPDNSANAFSFLIPWTKTTKDKGATVVATAQNGILATFCPFHALSKHLEANTDIPDNFSFFGYIDEHSKPQHMVKSTFLAFCDKIWKAAKLEHVHRHSFHIGSTVELLIAGIPPEVVATVGGWTSIAFLIYWRYFQDIIPTHVFKAYSPNQLDCLKQTLDDFCKANKIPDSLIDHCICGYNITEFEL
ncbi:hypothetical protein GYMLUDRAFT_165452, partial [Collybiopsis luxurians FD-317 M1]